MTNEELEKLLRDAGVDPQTVDVEPSEPEPILPTPARDVEARVAVKQQLEDLGETVRAGDYEKLTDEQRSVMGIRPDFDAETEFASKDTEVRKSGVSAGVLGFEEDFVEEEKASAITEQAAADLTKILMQNEAIARTVERYGTEEGGWVPYVNDRLGNLARGRGLTPGSEEWEQYVNDPVNRRRALKEIALFKTVGLWTAPVLVDSDFLLGNEKAPKKTYAEKLARATFSPTLEVIGVGGRGGKGRIIVRQASPMRQAFDLIDTPHAVHSAMFRRTKESPLDTAKLLLPGVMGYNLMTNKELQQDILQGIEARDNPMRAAMETEAFRAGNTLTKLGIGAAGLLVAMGLPDATVGLDVVRAARSVNKATDAKRIASGFEEIEKAANNMGGVDLVEQSLRKAMPQETQAFDRLKAAVTKELYQQSGKKGERLAVEGEEATRVSKLLPQKRSGGGISARIGDEQVTVFDMANRQPHLDPATRRRLAMSGGKDRELVGITYPEAYNLKNRLKEFDNLEALAGSGMDELLAPQYLSQISPAKADLQAFFEAFPGGKLRWERFVGETDRIGKVLTNDVLFKDEVLKALGTSTLDAAKERKLDGILKALDTDAKTWLQANRAGARQALMDGISDARKAIQAEHEARVIAATLFRQHLAKKFGFKADIPDPQLLAKARTLPDLSADARAFRERLVEAGTELEEANRTAALADLMAQRYAARTGRDISKWWQSRVGEIKQAEAPTPPKADPEPAPPKVEPEPQRKSDPEPDAEPQKAEPDVEPAPPKKADPEPEKDPEPEVDPEPVIKPVPPGLTPPPFVDPGPASMGKVNTYFERVVARDYNRFADEVRTPQQNLEYWSNFSGYGDNVGQVRDSAKSAKQMNAWLAKHGGSAVTRSLAKRLSPIMSGEYKIIIVPPATNRRAGNHFYTRSIANNAGAHVNPRERLLAIRTLAMSEATMMHELIHVATVDALKQAIGLPNSAVGRARKKLDNWSNEVRKQANRDFKRLQPKLRNGTATAEERKTYTTVKLMRAPYALGQGPRTNPFRIDEMVTYALTRSEVQDYLKTIKLPDPAIKAEGSLKRTARNGFNKFVNLVSELLFGEKRLPDAEMTALEESIRLSDELFRAIRKDKKLLRQQGVPIDQGPVRSPDDAISRAAEVTSTPEFRRWFGDSQVVDDSGAPLVVYHGTTSDFAAFDPSKIGTATDEGYLGRGFYFSAEPRGTDGYSGWAPWGDEPADPGASVMPVYLSIENPIRLTARRRTPPKRGYVDRRVHIRQALGLGENATAREVAEAAKTQGYDGVVYDHPHSAQEIVAFEPEQIKSIYNRGTFDPGSPQVLQSTIPGAEIEFVEDGRAVFRAFENADLNSVIHELGRLGRREMDPGELDALVAWLKTQDIDVGRRGADFTGDSAQVERAERAIADGLEEYIRTGALPDDAMGLDKVFKGMQDDIVTLYRGVVNLDGRVPDEIRPLLDSAAARLPDEGNPFPTVLDMVRRKVLGTKTDEASKAPDFADEVVREASRQGTTLTRKALNDAIDKAIEDKAFDRALITTEKPLFPELETPAPSGEGYTYTLRDMQALRKRWYDELSGTGDAAQMTVMETVTQDAFKQRKVTEQLFSMLEREPQYEMTRALHRKLTKELGQKTADKLVTQQMLVSEWGRDKFQVLLKPTVRMMFGWDAFEDLRDLPPAVSGSVLAGVRRVEQHVGDSIRLTTEVYSKKAGPERAKAKQQLYRYLSGGLARFESGGRPALSSGTDKFGDLAVEVQELLRGGDEAYLTAGESRLLQKFAYDVGARKGPEGRVRSPSGKITRGFAATDIDAATADVLSKVFFKQGTSHQFLHDTAKAFLGNETNVSAVATQQVLESLLYNLGVTKRQGKFAREAVVDGVKYPGGTSYERVQDFLEEIEKARRQGRKEFGAHANEQAVARMGVLIGAHGGAARTRQLWADMGIYVEGKVFNAFGRWSRGLSVDPQILPQVERVAKQYGLNPNFFKDQVFDVNAYLPLAARKRMTDALARGLVKEDSTVKLLASTDDDMHAMINKYYRFLKIQMTRGAFSTKQRYFFMNTFDHFNQMATVTGFAPALKSVVRVAAQDVAVLPGMSVVMAAGRRYDPAFPEKVRRVLQRGGDAAANAVGQMMANSKWRIDVNRVLEGEDGFVSLGGNVFSYRELREIATEEGIFASFDVSALRKSIQAAQDDMLKGLGEEAVTKLGDAVNYWRLHLDDTAEAWSERERLGAMITLIEMGVEPRNAARTTIDALFDYSGSMSKQDRNFFVGALMPFWAFQKNANMQFVNYLFSPSGAYRMGVLRRGQDRFAEAVTEALYAGIADPYGVDAESMPADLRNQYYSMIDIVENGYGPLDKLPQKTRLMLESTFGPIEELDPATRNQLENGYGGREKVPKSVVLGLRMMFRQTMAPRIGQEIDGDFKELGLPALHFTRDTALMRRFAEFSVDKPDPSGRRSYLRDRAGIALPLDAGPEARTYYKLLGQVRPDHPYLEVFIPESTVNAGMRHTASVLALYALIGDYGFRGGVNVAQNIAAKTGALDEKTMAMEGEEFALLPAFRNVVTGMADVERSPIISPVLASLGYRGAPPTRIHPVIADQILDTLGIEVLKIPGHKDIFAAVERGDLTMEQAEALVDSGELEFHAPVDEDGRAAALHGRYPAMSLPLAQRVVDVSGALGIPAGYLADLMRAETGGTFSASQRNLAGSGATGLIQFMPSTAKKLGTSTDALAKMSEVDQMNYVYRYLAPFAGKMKNRGDLHMAVFYPAAIGKGENFDISEDWYRRRKRQYSKTMPSEVAESRARAAQRTFIQQNGGIRTRGDYNRMFKESPTDTMPSGADIGELEEYTPAAPSQPLPLRAGEGFELKEDRYYMLPGAWQVAFQTSGLADLNRLLLGETPVARTPLERATVRGEGVETPMGLLASPLTPGGAALWARTLLGLQVNETSKFDMSKAEESRKTEESLRPPR